MLKVKEHITSAARVRIIVLLLLSLVSAIPDVTPDGNGRLMARVPESIHHENEIPEACQVSLRLEAHAVSRQSRRQRAPHKLAAGQLWAASAIHPAQAAWPRPAYYAHLHRYSLY